MNPNPLPLHTPAAKAAPAIDLTGPLAVVCRIGGSSPGISVANARGEVLPLLTYSWEEIRNTIATIGTFTGASFESPLENAIDITTVFPLFDRRAPSRITSQRSRDNLARSAEVLCEFLAIMIAQELNTLGILPEQLRHFGFAVAGVIDVENDTCLAANIPIKNFVTYPLIEKLPRTLEAIIGAPFRFSHVEALNDGAAAVYGEWLGERGFLRHGTGIAMIHGTGVGGCMLINGTLSPDINELGYTLLRPIRAPGEPIPPYEYCPLETLMERGCITERDGNVTVRAPEGYVMIEEITGGPWIAAHLVKNAQRAGLIGNLSKQSGLSVDSLMAIATLREEDSLQWNKEIDKDVVLTLSKYILSVHTIPEESQTALDRFTRAFELEVADEMGGAIKALREYVETLHPGINIPVVVVSSMAERRRDDEEYVRRMHRAAGTDSNHVAISSMEAMERESLYFTRGLGE